jgi:A/G-specific adenine glycosylase
MPLSPADIRRFRADIRAYYKKEGRKFPWRRTRDPYRIAVSEIMLQQTQTHRVVPKYRAWLREFPDWASLSRAGSSDVLRLWQGLGYNRRALALHRLAYVVRSEHGGKLPEDPALLAKLPGIGPYTAGAIAAFAFGRAVPIIETNIRRVFLHRFFKDGTGVPDSRILPLIEATLDRKDPRTWYWALMDLGASLGRLKVNPNLRSRAYRKQAPFKGSDREIRGKLLKLLLSRPSWNKQDLLKAAGAGLRGERSLEGLLREGFCRPRGGRIVSGGRMI